MRLSKLHLHLTQMYLGAAGWRSILEVLVVAATDFAAAVVNQALDALQPVTAALHGNVALSHQHFCLAQQYA